MPTTLLFVDDHVALSESVMRYIDDVRPEWRFLVANTCAEARRLHGESLPDAAVLDINLPDGNGLDLLSEFKAANPGLPVIMISGHAPPSLRQQILDRGGYAFLSKPFSGSIMLRNIELAISNSRNQPPMEAPGTMEASASWKHPCALVPLPSKQEAETCGLKTGGITRLFLK